MSGTGPARVERRYRYDGAGRLVEAHLGNGVVVTYTYDEAGNRTGQQVRGGGGEPEGGPPGGPGEG